MTAEEILLRRLAGQHLLFPSDTQTVVKDLCAGPVSEPCPAWTIHPLPFRQHRGAYQKLDEQGHHAPVLHR